jgi:spore germination cell wall hydrolase CwlJ-like protein
MIGYSHSVQREQADFRTQVTRLASNDDAGEVVRTAAHSPALLKHPWLQTVEYSLERDPSSILSRYAARDRDGAALEPLVSFKPEHMDRAETIAAEHMCMAQAVYYESANERVAGQIAVAEVIANRVKDHRYPNTVCGVVFQGATRRTGCQFSFTCDGSMKSKPESLRWEQSLTVASHVMMNQHERRTNGATHYHATYVNPVWNSGLVKTNKIGLHVFYRYPRGGEWARAERSQRARNATIRKASIARQNAAVEADLFDTAATVDDLNVLSLSTVASRAGRSDHNTVADTSTRVIKRVSYSPAP